MKTLEDGRTRIQQISDEIRKNVIDPSKKESQKIIEEGEQRKAELIVEGQREKERLIKEAHNQIAQDKNIFESALEQASKQSIESLKQQITHLFNSELQNMLSDSLSEPAIIASIIGALVKAIEKDGLDTDLVVVVAKSVNAEEVNKLLAKRVLQKLQKQSVEVGDISGGVKITVQGKNMSVSLTQDDIKKLLAEHLRKDFRKMIFTS
ncbi:MAG: V-type ATP synthase subunit E [Parachlamydiales bacterium]|jgi:V/A-type H+-transporting ATPase subunit E